MTGILWNKNFKKRKHSYFIYKDYLNEYILPNNPSKAVWISVTTLLQTWKGRSLQTYTWN